MATATQGEITEEQWHAWHAFYAMRRRLDHALDAGLQRESSISAAEYETLVALHRTPGRRLRVTELAVAMGWEKSRVSHQVSRMEKRGFVSRTSCETDARGWWIEMTTEGRRTVLRAMRGHTEAIRRYFFDQLDEDQAELLTELSARVLSGIEGGSVHR
ncbi:MAG: hypothetical protein JWL94_1059 [Microbacteriaceae bacterium]|jgi:DNA-binding MarR family transcriptional regulator|nr:hypothetical protein [Microbacteriaceae bacterium]HEV7957282.1 MarR family transcriptional regulator [Marisediminicola sp.]